MDVADDPGSPMNRQQKVTACRWRLRTGRCRRTDLIGPSGYCHVHYWRAIWAQSQLAATPLPENVDWPALIWIVVCCAVIGITTCWTALVTSIATSQTALSAIQTDPWFVAVAISDWALFTTALATTSAFFLVWSESPMLPARRIRAIRAALAVSWLSIAVAAVSVFVRAAHQNYGWYVVSGELLLIALTGVLSLFYAAVDSQRRPRVRANFLSVALAWCLLETVGHVLDAMTIRVNPDAVDVAGTLLALSVGLMLLTDRGRLVILQFFDSVVADLADATHPLELGMQEKLSVSSRVEALSRALSALSALTPEERDTVTRLAGEGRSGFGLGRLLLAAVVVVASTFFLEAPAQQVYLTLVCGTLHAGPPWCQ